MALRHQPLAKEVIVLGVEQQQSRKMFRINEDGVPEWVVAANKEQAVEFYTNLYGESTVQEAYEEYMLDIPGVTFGEFIDYYVKEESPDRSFTLIRDDEEKVKKTIGEFLTGVDEVPFYFACGN